MSDETTTKVPRHPLAVERERRGWSQTRVSALTGIAQPDISAIENRRRLPGSGWRRRLADVFGVSEGELFG
jgi:transcriptional regulator with XRE-family HTH domain